MPVARAVGVENHLAAEKIVGIEPAEHDVGVGDGRFRAAAAITDRPGIGARALRPDLERTDVVSPGDAAAAGADLDHVDHRQHDRMAAGVAADVIAGRQRRLAVAHQACLRGRAAHVERNHIGKAKLFADSRRGDDAADRPGFHHRDRSRRRDFRRHHAAVRAHDRKVAAKADVGKARIQTCDVAADLRSDIGVDHRCRHAFELAIFAQDVVRERQISVRQRLAHHGADYAFVLGIGIGVQEAHGDGFDALGGEGAAGVRDARLVQPPKRLA